MPLKYKKKIKIYCSINFPACIMRTYGEEYCREFENDLEVCFFLTIYFFF